MKALESDAPLIVYVDIKSPYAFVAIRPTLALEKSLGIRFDWRPLTLDIPSYLGSARKSKGKVVESTRSASQWTGIKYGYGDVRRYVERQGLMLKGSKPVWSRPESTQKALPPSSRVRVARNMTHSRNSFTRAESTASRPMSLTAQSCSVASISPLFTGT